MKNLVTPTINLNGNSASDLVEQLLPVIHAIADLQKAMGEANAVCHGRNFQTHADPFGAQAEASNAWGERRAWLRDLYNEVTDLAVAIQAQNRRRRA